VSVCGLVRDYRLWRYLVGDQTCCTSWRGRERCLKKSPLYLAKRVETLTLIIHSIEDYGTRPDKALPFFTALKLHGVETKPGEDELTLKGKP
jgi:acylaminoacyl-peptidase